MTISRPLRILALLACGIAVYWNTLSSPFVFDDRFSIAENPTIRSLSTALVPPPTGAAVHGRPVVNLSFALNYALGGLDPRGYHAANLAFHLAAVLLLFGIARRGFASAGLPDPETAGFSVALVWAVHPLLTESVTCVVQRTELLSGLFYLLTLYAFIRAVAENRTIWYAASIAACALGMASKEVMVGAPLIVLLYDRAFLGGGFAAAWRQRRRYYLGLGATWIVLGFLVISSGGDRGGTAGYGGGIGAWSYLLTQCRAIALYLRLSFFPHPLVVDYGAEVVSGPGEVWLSGLLVLGLAALTLWLLRAHPRLGFLGAWFFVILAPSSSVVPLVTQTIAEHRMYLPLASVVVGVVLLLQRWLTGRRTAVAALALAAVLGPATYARNRDYRDAVSLWTETVRRVPANDRAQSNLGQALLEAGRPAEAEPHLLESLRLKPAAETQGLLALVLESQGSRDRAMDALRRGIEMDPRNLHLHSELGRMLLDAKRPEAAIIELQWAVDLNPMQPESAIYLGSALYDLGRTADALACFQLAVRIAPDDVGAQYNLAVCLVALGRPAEAVAPLERALALQPGSPEIAALLARARAGAGK